MTVGVDGRQTLASQMEVLRENVQAAVNLGTEFEVEELPEIFL